VAASGNTVFTERVDSSLRNGHWVDIPLVAVFELNARGQIAVWREYLDLSNVAHKHGMSVETLRESLVLA
jgi:limonene-1,2-epoxide hydrolase